MAETDPITQVHDALWSLLEAHTPFTDTVRNSNRIKFTGASRSPDKDTHSSGDYPEVRIIPVGSSPHIQRTSSSSTLVKSFAIQVSSGDQRANILYDLEWEIYRAMAQWAPTLQALTWKDKTFVRLTRPTTVVTTMATTDMVQWADVWSCEIEMVFCTTDLEYEASLEG
jgi:hypothetical protein